MNVKQFKSLEKAIIKKLKPLVDLDFRVKTSILTLDDTPDGVPYTIMVYVTHTEYNTELLMYFSEMHNKVETLDPKKVLSEWLMDFKSDIEYNCY